MSRGEQYVFGEFIFLPAERTLLRNGTRVGLGPKPHDILVALVRSAGHLVTRRELLETVWSGSVVEDGALSVHVSALRKALGDRERHWIETVARSGYRFAPGVTHSRAPESTWTIGIFPVSPEIFELMGHGRAHLLAATPHDVPKAIDAFRAALGVEPNYAPAHAGLARAYCAQAQFRQAPHAEAYREAQAAALRALAMDPSSADAQFALGTVLFLNDWNWTGAKRSFRRALELNPDLTEAYLSYGELLEATGLLDEGLRIKQRALQRDPHSALVQLSIAMSHWNRREFDESLGWANRALDSDPTHLLAREFLAGAYWKTCDFDGHMREMIKHAECHGVPAAALGPLREAYARGGRPAVVRLGLEHGENRLPPMQLALLHAEIEEMDAAFEQLDRAIAGRDPCLVHLAVAPQWDHMRADSRFAQRLAKMDLPPVIPPR